MGGATRVGLLGSVTFHKITLLSRLPLASVRPSGENATEYTSALCPVKGWPS
jgi:hypothetical protein